MKLMIRTRKYGDSKWWITNGNYSYLWKTDLELHKDSTGYDDFPEDPPGYFDNHKEAELCLEKYLNKENKMYTMRNGKEVSETTVEIALQEHFKANPEPKPKFEPIQVCHVNVSVGGDYLVVIKVDNGSHNSCRLYADQAGELAAALQQAKAFAIANKP